MKCRALVALVLLALTIGCTINGDGIDSLSLFQDLFVIYGGGLDVDSSFKSPTVEKPEVHRAGMVASKHLVLSYPRVQEWAQENKQVLFMVAKTARCPVCKGALMALGGTIHYIGIVPESGFEFDRDIWVSFPDGSTIGKLEE